MLGAQQPQSLLLVTASRLTIGPDDPPPRNRRAEAGHHRPDLTGTGPADRSRDIAVGRDLSGRDLFDQPQHGLHVGVGIGRLGRWRHQPLLPGTPLNGPATVEVIQPP